MTLRGCYRRTIAFWLEQVGATRSESRAVKVLRKVRGSAKDMTLTQHG